MSTQEIPPHTQKIQQQKYTLLQYLIKKNTKSMIDDFTLYA